MHGTSIPPSNGHFSSTESQGCPISSVSTESTISFFSAGATTLTTLDNPSGVCPIVSSAPTLTLIAVLLCLFVSFSTYFNFSPISGLFR